MQSPLISYGSDSVANVNLLTYTEKGTEPLLKRPITVYKYKSVNININPQNDIHILYDFLIDGYIRNIIYNGTTYQEYNAQLFPIAVKQIIESHCRQTECEWRLISYFKQKRHGTQFGVLVNVWCNLMISAPAFFAIYAHIEIHIEDKDWSGWSNFCC
eukprot:888808_1